MARKSDCDRPAVGGRVSPRSYAQLAQQAHQRCRCCYHRDTRMSAHGRSNGGPVSDRLISAPEAAEQLNVSVRTIYSWISSGRLPSVRLSARCTRVPAAAVEALIRSSAKHGRPDLAPLLWDIDPDRIDEVRDADFLIVRILTAGRPEHVSWMFRRYPRAKIERIVAADRRLSDRVAGGWRNLLGLGSSEARS